MATGDMSSPSPQPGEISIKTPPSQPPQLRYFISRSNGTFVPLIPADELPFNIRLEGVQRVINIESASGMTLVGTQPFTGRFFHLADISNANRHANISESTHRRIASEFDTKSNSTTHSTRSLPPSTIATNWRSQSNHETQTQAKIDEITGSSPGAPARSFKPHSDSPSTSPRISPAADKVYCTYWIRHGECDYEQQGCRYKHEVPDQATLAKIGFGGGVPRWYQERMRVRLGQSRIPTVGEVVKPGVWLKRRGSHGRESGESESESESENEANPVAKREVSTTSTRSDTEKGGNQMDMDSKDDSQYNIQDSEDEQDQMNSPELLRSETESTAKTRQSSTTSDLIDLSPATGHVSLGPGKTFSESGDAFIPAPMISTSPANKQARQTPAPRKVFVPAGEHPRFHIAQSRKHAQKAIDNNAHDQSSDHQISTSKHLSTKDAPTEKHAANTTKRPEPLHNQGLMASGWAPIVPSPSNDIDWDQVDRETKMRLMDFGKAPEFPGRPAVKVPGSGSANNRQGFGTNSENGARSGEGKKALESPSGCRPRRPAGTGSKI